MLGEFSSIFSSRTKSRVLEVLFYLNTPISLRQVAEIADGALRPVELALKDLLRQKMVKRARSGNRTLYKLNREHEFFPILQATFTELQRYKIKQGAKRLSTRVPEVLMFVSSTHKFLHRIKELNK